MFRISSLILRMKMYNEDLRANPPQGEEFNAEQSTRFNLLVEIKTIVQVKAMMTFENRAQGLDLLKPLLT